MSYRRRRRLEILALVSLSIEIAALPAGAQQVPTTAPAVRADLEEIIVTAQKRAERVQDVPISITALSAADLEQKRFFNLSDLRDAVPNFSAEEVFGSPSTASFFLRGHGSDADIFSFDSPVAVYVDGVYLARNKGALLDLVDVDRIEVLRGPQGTLFGRNASAGAIRIVSRNAPLQDGDFEAEVATGSNDLVDARLTFGTPLIEDEVGLRLSLLSRNQDGYMLNLVDGSRAQADDISQAKMALRWAPNEAVELSLRADMMRDRSTGRVGSNYTINPDNNLYTFESNTRNEGKLDSSGVSLTVDWNTQNFELTSISAYRDLQTHGFDGDLDGSAERLFEVDLEALEQWQATQEVFLVGEQVGGIALQWTAGAFYLHEFNDYLLDVNFFEDVLGDGPAGLFEQDTDAFAPYAQLTYPVTHKLNLTGGLRWTYEKKDMTARQRLPDGTLNPDFEFAGVFEDRVWTWRANADYKATDDILLYAYSATGYRSGGFNGSATTVEEITSGGFGSEDVITYEAGIKSDWLDRTLRLNLAYYYNDYSGFQTECNLNPEGGFGQATNVSMQNHGVEAEVAWLPFEALELTANYGNVDKIIKGLDAQCAGGATEDSTYTYEWNVAMVYSASLPNNGGTVRFAADYSGQNGESRTINPTIAPSPVALVDAHIAYISPDKRWQFILSGYNLTDDEYPTLTLDIPDLTTVAFPNEPRRWTFSLKYRM